MDWARIFPLIVIFAGIALGLVAVVGLRLLLRGGREREARRLEERQVQVEAKGWHLETVNETNIKFRIFGGSRADVGWEMSYDSDAGSTDAKPKLVWRAIELSAPRTEFWSTSAVHSRVLKSGAANMAMRLAGQIGSVLPRTGFLDRNELLSEGQVHTPRSAILREWFAVFCRDPARCARVFDAEVERLLLSFPASSYPKVQRTNLPEVQFGAAGLEIRVGNRDGQMPVIEHLAALGTAIAQRIQGRAKF